jgi:uncharacterized protein YjiS (DUF1127 family)
MEIEMTMTLMFDDAASETSPANAKASGASVFKTIATALAAWRAARARRVALSSLLEMEAHRLDDLGITVQDVVDALGRRRPGV